MVNSWHYNFSELTDSNNNISCTFTSITLAHLHAVLSYRHQTVVGTRLPRFHWTEMVIQGVISVQHMAIPLLAFFWSFQISDVTFGNVWRCSILAKIYAKTHIIHRSCLTLMNQWFYRSSQNHGKPCFHWCILLTINALTCRPWIKGLRVTCTPALLW